MPQKIKTQKSGMPYASLGVSRVILKVLMWTLDEDEPEPTETEFNVAEKYAEKMKKKLVK